MGDTHRSMGHQAPVDKVDPTVLYLTRCLIELVEPAACVYFTGQAGSDVQLSLVEPVVLYWTSRFLKLAETG